MLDAHNLDSAVYVSCYCFEVRRAANGPPSSCASPARFWCGGLRI